MYKMAVAEHLNVQGLTLEVFEVVSCGGELDLVEPDQTRCTTQGLFPFSVTNRWLNQNIFHKSSSFSSAFSTAHGHEKVVTEAKPLPCRQHRR